MRSSTIRNFIGFAGIILAFIIVLINRTGTPEEPLSKVDCDLSVFVAGVNSYNGSLYAVLCKQNENFPNSCEISQAVKAKEGTLKFDFTGVPNGMYAFAAYHDENDDQVLNMSKGRFPSEGLVFSNNAIGSAGPPSFKQSSFELCKNSKLLANIRYIENR